MVRSGETAAAADDNNNQEYTETTRINFGFIENILRYPYTCVRIWGG